MGEGETATNYVIKINQVKSNLKNWNFYEWVIFWVVIPAFLFIIYSLPQGIKDEFFILNTSYLWRVQTFLFSSYTHSQIYPHFVGNLAFYLGALLMIFAFEKNKRRFWIMAGWSLLVVPVISSTLTIVLWSIFSRTTTGQGFSAINGAFLAYAMFIFVIWSIHDELEVFDDPDFSPRSKIRFQLSKILITVILALIVVMGVLSGIFTDAGGAISNGIAHFGGFITSLIMLLVYDIRTEKRRYFDTMLGISILIGICWYWYYLFNLIRAVKGT